jgi:hypothetical protein
MKSLCVKPWHAFVFANKTKRRYFYFGTKGSIIPCMLVMVNKSGGAGLEPVFFFFFFFSNVHMKGKLLNIVKFFEIHRDYRCEDIVKYWQVLEAILAP